MKVTSIILQFAGVALLFTGTQAFVGLKASVTFGTTISASTTKLSAGFATAGTNIGKILDQAVLLSVSLPMPVEDLKTIKATFAYFTATYVALGAAFMNATGPAIAVTATLNDGVKYLDTFLPAFGLAMFNLETFTSIKLLQFFPSDAQQQGLKVAFTNVFTAVVSLNDKVGVTTADINAVLAAADLKVIQDFYDYYNSAIASVNIQLTIILGQFTGLVTIQTALLKNIVSFPGEMLAWNVKLAAAATKTIPTITASLAAELKAEQTVVTGILAKLVTYVENDEDVNIPGAINDVEAFGKKYKLSIRNATASIISAGVTYTDLGQSFYEESNGAGVNAVNLLLSNIAIRIFSPSNVLALKCGATMTPDWVKDQTGQKNDVYRCMNDLLNYLPQSNDFITLEMTALKAVAAWRLGSVLTCTKYITDASTDTTAVTAFGSCLSKTAGYLNNNYVEIGAYVNNISNQINDDLATVTSDFGNCFGAMIDLHGNMAASLMATYDKCAKYTAPKAA